MLGIVLPLAFHFHTEPSSINLNSKTCNFLYLFFCVWHIGVLYCHILDCLHLSLLFSPINSFCYKIASNTVVLNMHSLFVELNVKPLYLECNVNKTIRTHHECWGGSNICLTIENLNSKSAQAWPDFEKGIGLRGNPGMNKEQSTCLISSQETL